MTTKMQSWVLLWIASALQLNLGVAFAPLRVGLFVPRSTEHQKLMMLDPHHVVTDAHQMMDSVHAAQSQYEALISTLVSAPVAAVNLEAAHGHSNSLFGAPDQFLQAGKSIAPMNLRGPDVANIPEIDFNLAEPSQELFNAELTQQVFMLHVMRKLPMAALLYTLTEFFVIKPTEDLYPEDIEDDRAGIMKETVNLFAMRLISAIIIISLTMEITNIFG